MANQAIRKYGFTHLTSPVSEKVAHVLSDGTRVAVLGDSNQAGITGAGGDSTAVPKTYVYTQPAAGGAWTLRATVTGMAYLGASRIYVSSALDSLGNIHLVYIGATSTVKYRLLTLGAGPTYTVGAEEAVVAAPAAGFAHGWIDIDVAGTTSQTPVIVVNVIKTTVTKSSAVRVLVRNTSNVWVAHTDVPLFTGDQPASYTNGISVSCNQAAHAAGINTVMIVAGRKGLAGTDLGDVIWATEINFTTGARVSNTFLTYPTSNVKAWHWGKANGIRKYRIFNTGADEWIIAGTVNLAVWELFVTKVTYNRTTDAFTSVITPRYKNDGASTIQMDINRLNYSDVIYSGTGGLLFVAHSNNFTYSWAAKIDGVNVTFAPAPLRFTNSVNPGGALASQIWAGNQRTPNDPTRVFMVSTHQASATVAEYNYHAFYRQSPTAPANVMPASGATVATDLPELRADHRMPEQYVQVETTMEWQLATDANFTTNVRTVTGTTYLRADNATSASPATVRSIMPLPLASELYQGLWFARARAIDRLGVAGAWSSGGSGFTVAHPPVADGDFPSGGVLIPYVDNGSGAHVMAFSWTFTDSSPTDAQTAYEIVLIDRLDDSQIFSTGKVVSSLKTGTIGISSVHKDKELGWQVRVYDSDDVVGVFSALEIFYLLDSVTVTITSPPGTPALTSAIVNVTWTHNLINVRYQDYVRVIVRRDLDSAIIYNSGWYRSTATAHVIPTGYLRNDTAYTAEVMVRDNLRIEAVDVQTFTTDWVDPTAPPQQARVSLVPYDKFGYVWISVSPTGADVDFIGYNLYRREVGSAVWELLNVWTDDQRLMTYADYGVGSKKEYEYVVTQMVERFGDVLESPIGSSVAVRVKPLSSAFWLTFGDDTALKLRGANGLSITDEYESETYHVQGFGRRREVGDRLGYTGSLTCQLRDKYLTAIPTVNYLANPNFLGDEIVTAGVVTGIPSWNLVHTETGNAVSQTLQGTLESLPSTAKKARVLSTDAFGAADSMAYEQRIDNNKPINLVTSGGQFSVWVAGVLDQQLVLTVRMYSAAASLLNTATVTISDEATAVEVMTPSVANSPDAGHAALAPTTEWRRYRLNVPAYTAQPVSYILVKAAWQREVGTAVETFTITGSQYQTGLTLTPLVTGDMEGAWFDGDDLYSPSYTDGVYSARQQRLDLEAVRKRVDVTLLRTPFGDNYAVGVGDIGVTFIAGTVDEMSDVTIPFMELGE